jgi:hypothetical protein
MIESAELAIWSEIRISKYEIRNNIENAKFELKII